MTPSKRKRPITSCTECYRRKQKCDRRQPCAICSIRGIPDRCTFDGHYVDVHQDVIFQPPKRKARSLASENVTDQYIDVSHDSSSSAVDLGEQTGYSLANQSNFSILRKSLRDEDVSTPTSYHQSAKVVPDFILYQIAQVERHLPCKAIQERLTDLYFERCWWWFHGLEPKSFKRQFAKWHAVKTGIDSNYDLKDSLYFSALLFQVLAIGLQYLEESWTDVWQMLDIKNATGADLLSMKYSNSGAQIMDLLGRHDPTLTAVQHDMTRGVWLKNSSRGTESWYSLGNAIRQAQELWLHHRQEPPSSLTAASLNTWLWDKVQRERVWVCLFDWDAHVSFLLGRPRIINVNDCARVNLVACDFPEDTTLQPPPMKLIDQSQPHLVTPILFHYGMSHLIHKMLDHGADNPNLTDYGILETLHGDMEHLLNELPSYLRFEDPNTTWDLQYPNLVEMRLHLCTLANTYLVALHRAHVLRRPKSREAAITSALTTLAAQEQLFRKINKQKWRIYTYSFYTIDASIFLAALLLEQPDIVDNGQYTQILDSLQEALCRLEKMREISLMAKTGAQVIQRCCERLSNYKTLAPVASCAAKQSDLSDDALDERALPTAPTHDSNDNGATSLRLWIEQMDRVMLPMLEADQGGPFDHALWEAFLES